MIQVEGMAYTYAGTAVTAVRGLSFAVARGEIFGFLGPSGAGKSTTQKVLNGLLREYTGQAQVLGKEVREWGSDYYERIGVSFELPNHYQKLTARENLSYFGALYGRETLPPQALLELVGLDNDGDLLVSQYSKGMKNRLGVARAMLHQPDLLFLDEPTSGLDPVNARRIKALIRAQKERGATVFLTTHDMSVADELCDRVGFIMDGEIRLIDSPRALKLQYGRAQVKVEYQADGRLAEAFFALAGLADDGRFLELLRHSPVQTLHTQEATLDDIFVAVTGRPLA